MGPRPTIVIVAIDTLRPDHLGCYGYSFPTSPAIDRLAQRSVVFDRAFAAGIPTTPSFTTLLSGLHPYHHGVVTHPGDYLPESVQLLSQLARSVGYRTIACDNMVVQSAGRGAWFARGYDHYSGFVYTPFGTQSADITDRALRLLARSTDQPTLLFVHYWDPHTPYGPRPPFDTMHYRPGSGPGDLSDVRAINPDYYDAILAEMNMRDVDDYAYVVAQYDGEISQVDEQVGRLIDGLQAGGTWDDTIVLLVSDHGEAFGEGGLYFDHHGLYDGVTNLAMMMRLPDHEGGRSSALVSNEDIVPTLCELADIGLPEYRLTGRSLVPLLDHPATTVRDQIVTTESSRQASIALRTATHKLIVPVTEDASGQRLPDVYGRPRAPEPLLYDLLTDPSEVHDVAGTQPDRAASMRAELDAWRAAALAATGGSDPLIAHGLSLPIDKFMKRRRARMGDREGE